MLSYDLREKVLAYAEGRITVEELEDWLVPRLPMYLTPEPSDDARLASVVELGLAELGDGLTTEGELRASLLARVCEERTVLFRPGASWERTSASVTRTRATFTPTPETAPFTVLTW